MKLLSSELLQPLQRFLRLIPAPVEPKPNGSTWRHNHCDGRLMFINREWALPFPQLINSLNLHRVSSPRTRVVVVSVAMVQLATTNMLSCVHTDNKTLAPTSVQNFMLMFACRPGLNHTGKEESLAWIKSVFYTTFHKTVCSIFRLWRCPAFPLQKFLLNPKSTWILKKYLKELSRIVNLGFIKT